MYFDKITIRSGVATTGAAIYYTGGLYYGAGATLRGIPSEDIRDGAVTTSKMADGAVTSAKILNNTITADDIGTGAVGSDEIKDNTVGILELHLDTDTSTVRPGVTSTKIYITSSYHLLFSGTEPATRLSSFSVGYYSWYWYITFYNDTDETHTWRLTFIRGSPEEQNENFIMYDTITGEIKGIIETFLDQADPSLVLLETFQGYGFSRIDNHPDEENILMNPDNYYFDIERGTVTRKAH